MKAGVSVVICTCNGAAVLPQTLRHLALQQVRPDIPWEIIIVNNASTDNTSEVVTRTWESYNNPVRFQVLYQPQSGLSFAREMGLQQSSYDFVLFCDDDNWLCPGYINLAFDLMAENPQIGALGGHGELVYEISPPSWSLAHKLIACGPQAPASGRVKHHVVYGAGCILRKPAYHKLREAGFNSLLSDRQGSKLSSGGDYELCLALALAGYEIWYEEQLRFKHFVPARRLTYEYHLRYFKENAQSLEALVPYRLLHQTNSSNLLYLRLKLLLTWLSYGHKYVILFVQTFLLNANNSITSPLPLQLVALKAKLASFRNYRSMQRNFRQILRLKSQLDNR